MAIISYKNLQVESAPTGDAGIALNNNFETIADNLLQINANGSIQADSGGNSRGVDAVDLQQSRISSLQVASGNYSIISGGINNKSSGIASYAEGKNTVASGTYSHAEGSGTSASNYNCHAEGFQTTASGYASHTEGNNTTASSYASHAEGFQTTASGDYSHSEGHGAVASAYSSHAEGDATTASGVVSHSEGSTTTASGTYSHAEGDSTLASGTSSHAQGASTVASGTYSHSEGYQSHATFVGHHAFGIGGLGQGSRVIVQNTTVNATPTELFNNSSNRLVIPIDSTWAFTVLVVARRSDAQNESAGYKIEGVIDNNTDTVALVAMSSTTLGEDNAGWNAVAEADNTNKALVIRVTGENAKTIKWLAVVNLAEITVVD